MFQNSGNFKQYWHLMNYMNQDKIDLQLTFIKIHQVNTIKIIKKDFNKKACERYQSFSKEEKEKNWQYDCEQYKNLPEDQKQKLIQYRKKDYKMRKNSLL